MDGCFWCDCGVYMCCYEAQKPVLLEGMSVQGDRFSNGRRRVFFWILTEYRSAREASEGFRAGVPCSEFSTDGGGVVSSCDARCNAAGRKRRGDL